MEKLSLVLAEKLPAYEFEAAVVDLDLVYLSRYVKSIPAISVEISS